VSFQGAGNDPRYGLVAVANQDLFAVTHELNMCAKVRFQFGNINGLHEAIILKMTMLVIFYFPALEELKTAADTPASSSPADSKAVMMGRSLSILLS
jgi:hypothetical protein